MSQPSAAKLHHHYNSSSGCTYRFIDSSLATLSPKISCDLELRQQPVQAKVSIINERDRRPLEPPPILQLHWTGCTDEELKKCLQSPFYYVVANLVTEDNPETPLLPAEEYLSGSPVSSLHRLRDIDNSEGGYFVFGDLAVKKGGRFKLRFSLFEIIENGVHNCRTLLSNTFTVYIPKHYPGPVEATFLSRTFSDQGVKMRIRKEHRIQRKRKHDNSNSDTSSTTSTSDINSQQPAKKASSSKSSGRRSIGSSNISIIGSDVHFGRWQAIPPSSHIHTVKTNQQDQHSVASSVSFPSRQSTLSPPPSQQRYYQQHYVLPEHSHNSVNSLGTGHYFEKPTMHPSQPVSFPSPESTINNNINTAPYPTFAGRGTATKTSTFFAQHDIHCFSSTCQLPKDRSLDRYHTCNDRHITPSENRLPTPPLSITDLHLHATGTQSWGMRLPPLKAIMNDRPNTHAFSSKTATTATHTTTTTAPLLMLPPPPALLTMGHPSHYAYQ